jgi:hypothetical protein
MGRALTGATVIASAAQTAAPPTSTANRAGRLHAAHARSARRIGDDWLIASCGTRSQRSKSVLVIVASPFDYGHAWPTAFNDEGGCMLAICRYEEISGRAIGVTDETGRHGPLPCADKGAIANEIGNSFESRDAKRFVATNQPLASGVSATAASAVSRRKLKVSWKYNSTTVPEWLW